MRSRHAGPPFPLFNYFKTIHPLPHPTPPSPLSEQHAHNLMTLIEKTGAKAYLINTAIAGAEQAVVAAAAGNAPAVTIQKNAVTADALKRVSALVAGHNAANAILEGASRSFV
jgi:hypothetical protein